MKRALALAPWLLLSCTNQLPGDTVGTYRVVMTLVENTCGPKAVFTQDGKGYSVELREDRGRGYWHITDQRPVQGTLDAKHNFKFTFSSLVASEGPDAGPDACRLVQDELLSGSLRSFAAADGGTADGGGTADADAKNAADAPLSTLVGEHVFRISSYAGTDCSRALQTAGGPFEALPCTIRYTLSGTERDPF